MTARTRIFRSAAYGALAAAVLATILTGTLAGCGQKGALYLPQHKKSKVPANPTNPTPDSPDAAPGAGPQAPPASQS
ncbi:MAG TPA: lipoprotein [Steroidobacteraceae bacterium]|jgi:predicted small lipoprotein YifL